MELCRARTPEELEQGKQILEALHTERWRKAGAKGAFAAPRFGAFHDAVMPELLAQGALDLVWLRGRGAAVAAAYHLVWNGKVAYYQCGRRLDLPAALRPGMALLGYAIRAAIEQGQREFDFLGEASEYKMQLALATRPLLSLRAVRPCLREYARRVAERGLGWARAVRNSVRWAARQFRDTPGQPTVAES
jgi:CelD/BcsL family acetyltransferase involved in cellulose biosynthesis